LPTVLLLASGPKKQASNCFRLWQKAGFYNK